jgi:outer membrane protein
MRRLLMSALIGAVVGGAGEARAQTLKIGYIHSEAIIAQDPDAVAAQEQFRQDMGPWENELRLLEEEIGTLLNQYQAQQVTLTPDARRTRQRAIVERQESYQQRLQQIEAAASQRQQELVQPIMEKINEVIQDLRAEGDYTFIFDASAGGLIAADEAFDLTDEVVRRLAARRAVGGAGR